MRILVETRRVDGGGWTVAYNDPSTGTVLAPPRTLARHAAPHAHLPRPPAHAAAACEAAVHALCEDTGGNAVAAAIASVHHVDVNAAAITLVGRYLTQVLLGLDRWQMLQAAAAVNENIELEVLSEAADTYLASLPWEMMHDLAGPLAGQTVRKVPITRIVETIPVPALPGFRLPLRVLFVVGRQIDDVLRPGAEIIALLRRLQVPVAPGAAELQSTDLNVRYLGEATADEITSTVAEFHPDVVHLICHGEVDPQTSQTRLLLTRRQVEGDPTSEKITEPQSCTADRLVGLLETSVGLPRVVVVNACHTADVNREAQSAAAPAFAASLVARGVPLAVGMAGEVADLACQMFTLRFYQTLLQGGSVAVAAAHGRRAALLGFPEYGQSIEWSRPTLFIAKGVDPILPAPASGRDLSGVARRYRKMRAPEALCDRYDMLQAYEVLRARVPSVNGQTPALGFEVKDAAGGVGKTRLLEEIAARAVFDNFIPVIVRHDNQNREPAVNVLEVALKIDTALDEARKNFGVDERELTVARKFAFQQAGMIPIRDDLAAYAAQVTALETFLTAVHKGEKSVRLPMALARQFIQAECTAIRDAVQVKTGEPHHVLVLLDDLHRYADATAIIDETRDYGLGKQGLPLPLVFTYSAVDPEGRSLEMHLKSRPDIRRISLTTFENPVDQRLVFSQLVLSQWKCVVNANPKARVHVEGFFEDMRDCTAGRPGKFADPKVEAFVKVHTRYNTLIPANFEELFRQWN